MPRIASLSSYKNVFLSLPFAQGRTEGVCASSTGYFSWVTCFLAFFFCFPGSFLRLPSAGSFLFLLYYELFLSFLFFTVSSFLSSFELNTDGKCFGVAFLVLSNFNCKKKKKMDPGCKDGVVLRVALGAAIQPQWSTIAPSNLSRMVCTSLWFWFEFFWIQHIYPKLPKIFMELRVDMVTYFDEFQELGQLIK